jgi:hypothetical protein
MYVSLLSLISLFGMQGRGETNRQVYLASAPTKPITHSSSSTSALSNPLTLDPSVPAKVLKAVREAKVHQTIKDLDNHLEDS